MRDGFVRALHVRSLSEARTHRQSVRLPYLAFPSLVLGMSIGLGGIGRRGGGRVPVFYTSTDGAATLSIRANTWQITTMNGRSAQGIADPLRPVAGD